MSKRKNFDGIVESSFAEGYNSEPECANFAKKKPAKPATSEAVKGAGKVPRTDDYLREHNSLSSVD